MKKKKTMKTKAYPKMDQMGDVLNPAQPPQPGDESTQLYANPEQRGY